MLYIQLSTNNKLSKLLKRPYQTFNQHKEWRLNNIFKAFTATKEKLLYSPWSNHGFYSSHQNLT